MCRAATAANAVGHFLEASIPGRTGWLGRVPAPRRSCDVANPLRCLGEMLATFVGRALGAAFFLLGKARGRKALHPRGEVLRGLIARHSAVGKTGVPWLDEAGTDHVAVRFSRSWVCPLPAQTSWVWHCGSPRNLVRSVMCFWRQPEQDCSADTCCCRLAGVVSAPIHRCFRRGSWLAPSYWQRFRPRAVPDSTSWPTPGCGDHGAIRDTGRNADEIPWS
jgi:hypothetical protein